MYNKNAFTNLLIILVVVLVFIIGSFFVLSNKNELKAPLEELQPSPTQTWKVYNGTGFTFSYPPNILIYPTNPEKSSSVYLTNKENVNGPREMPSDGIWIEATVYPSSAKDSLITDTQKILSDKIGAEVTHPITPYPEKFIKIKNLDNNGFVIKSLDEKDVNDSKEVESAIWLQNNTVYQLRMVVVTQKTFNDFEKDFNQILSTFMFTDPNTKSCNIDSDCGQDLCNQALPTTCDVHKCVSNKCITETTTYN